MMPRLKLRAISENIAEVQVQAGEKRGTECAGLEYEFRGAITTLSPGEHFDGFAVGIDNPVIDPGRSTPGCCPSRMGSPMVSPDW